MLAGGELAMPLIEWKDEYKLGIASVDFEHRSLIELINNLHANLAMPETRSSTLDFLGEVYTQISSHFALEERVMRDLKYDQVDDHKTDHEALLDEIRDIMDAFEAGDFDNADDVLGERLKEWFGRHFKTKDARLHHFFQEKGVH
jgi:hemerythrin